VKIFKDNEQREWSLAINVSTIKRVRDLVGVDLLEIADGTLLQRLMSDPVLLCDVIYAVCKPDADEQEVADEDFGRAMAGDALDQATKALLEDLVDFFPSPRDRANLRTVLATTWKAIDRAGDLIEQRLAGGELERAVDQALASAGDSSGNAPESSASIPTG